MAPTFKHGEPPLPQKYLLHLQPFLSIFTPLSVFITYLQQLPLAALSLWLCLNFVSSTYYNRPYFVLKVFFPI